MATKRIEYMCSHYKGKFIIYAKLEGIRKNM